MTVTNDRQGRTAVNLLPFLPLALIITMFGVAVFIAQIAPGRVTSGVYQVPVGPVIVGEGPAQFPLAAESLTCSRTGDTTTCTAPVAGRQLTVDIRYDDFDFPMEGSTCTARHGDRPVSCMSGTGGYGDASHSVQIFDQLGVTEPELTRLRDAVPWWRTGDELLTGALVLLCVLTATTGVTAYLRNGRTRPQAAEWRFPIAAGTGFLGLALFVAGSLIISSGHRIVFGLFIAGAPVWLASAMLMAWQYQLGGAGGHGRGRRLVYAIGGAIVTAFYIAATMFVFLLDD